MLRAKTRQPATLFQTTIPFVKIRVCFRHSYHERRAPRASYECRAQIGLQRNTSDDDEGITGGTGSGSGNEGGKRLHALVDDIESFCGSHHYGFVENPWNVTCSSTFCESFNDFEKCCKLWLRTSIPLNVQCTSIADGPSFRHFRNISWEEYCSGSVCDRVLLSIDAVLLVQQGTNRSCSKCQSKML